MGDPLGVDEAKGTTARKVALSYRTKESYPKQVSRTSGPRRGPRVDRCTESCCCVQVVVVVVVCNVV